MSAYKTVVIPDCETSYAIVRGLELRMQECAENRDLVPAGVDAYWQKEFDVAKSALDLVRFAS